MQIKRKYGKKIVLALTLGIIMMGLNSIFALSAEKSATLSFVTERAGVDYETMVALFEKFEEQYPQIKIECSRIPYDNFEEKLTTMVIGREAPDIAWLLGRWVAVYAAMNAALELTPYLPAEYETKFTPGLWTWTTYKDKAIALPLCFDGSGTFGYNTDYLKMAGVQVPGMGDELWTWDEFKTVCTKLKEMQLPDLEYPMMFWSRSVPIRLNSIYQNHGSILTEDLSGPAINSPESVEALKWMNSFFREGLAPTTNFTAGHQDVHDYWAAGKIAIVPIFLSSLQEYDGKIGGRFEWRAMPLPYPKKPIKQGAFDPLALMVFNQTEYPEEAAQLVTWLTSRENMAEFCNKAQYGPSRPDVAELIETITHFEDAQMIFASVERMPEQIARAQTSPAWSEIDKKLRVETELMAMGQKSPEETAENFARMIEEILKKYE